MIAGLYGVRRSSFRFLAEYGEAVDNKVAASLRHNNREVGKLVLVNMR
jgi:hypothetical protein